MKLFVAFLSLVVLAAAAEIGRENRISGGQVATRTQFPYAVGLFVGLDTTAASICGGSLISTNFVLTAAHCIFGRSQIIGVFGGTEILNANQAGQQRIVLSNFIVHPNYEDDNEFSSDIGLIGIPASLTFNEFIQPMILPNLRQQSNAFSGQQGVTIGWGRTADGTTALSPELRWVPTQIITNLSCSLSWPLSIQSNHMCASGATDMQAPCPGDDGGPMTITDAEGRTFQVGVLSFMSILGCQAGRPAVYTRLTEYLQWIENNSDVVIREDF